MENLLETLTTVGQISALVFGAMVIVAMALASLSMYHRNRPQS
ncbi:hypothetical protein [Nesterenkonia haasae]|nr:hypothetical protein [Nesterenkonia haasae]